MCSFNAHDTLHGLYLDIETGMICRWGEFGERQPEFESLTTFLEEMADALEAPSLAGPAKPGLVNGGLAWVPFAG